MTEDQKPGLEPVEPSSEPAAEPATEPSAEPAPENPKAGAQAPKKPSTSRKVKAAIPRTGRPALRRRRGLRTTVTVLGSVGIAIVAGAVVTAGSWPVPLSGSHPVAVPAAALPSGPNLAVCPGPAQLLQGAGTQTDPQFSPGSSDAKTTVSALVGGTSTGLMPQSVLASMPGTGAPLATVSQASTQTPTPSLGGGPVQQQFASLAAQSVGQPSVLRADPVGDQRSSAAAVLTYTAGTGDLRGLAAASCQTPGNEVWLLGASTEVGRTAILQLSNASTIPANVTVDLYGTSGPLQATGSKDLLVPPNSVKSVVVAGLAGSQKDLALRIRSSGGPVSATIQQSVLRGLTPGGVDFLTAVAPPSQQQVMTAVQVMDPALASSISGQSGYQDAQTTLRVLNPGAVDTMVRVQALGQSGPVALPQGGVFTAKAGSVTELPISGLPQGTYTLAVDADASVIASVRTVSGTKAGEAVDLAESGANAKLTDSHLVVLPSGVSSKLVFSAPAGAAQLSLTPIGTDGKPQAAKTLTLSAGKTVVVDPAQWAGGAVSGFLVSASGSPAFGAQLLSQNDGISVLAIPRNPATLQSVQVGLGY
ncbi:DUF5719 family protein [Psychromicrobium xiongbiense]|uniref:DUF5719 family protein n=1 Tax=Psychromicrobium xiongbiense TaxID=3051184 RepID=UPI002554E6DE|nr:DUF5719 family protein [Psychromicrobium sp. YIM S02556]